jgi:hypothetical protein
MPTGRPETALILTDDEREQLWSLARSRALPHAIVARAKVVLWVLRVASYLTAMGRCRTAAAATRRCISSADCSVAEPGAPRPGYHDM